MNKAKKNIIEKGILYNKLVDLKITAPDVVLEICEARNKELDIAIKEIIDDRHRVESINLECARISAIKKVFEDVAKACRKAKNITQLRVKMFILKEKHLNTSNTENKNETKEI